MNGSLSSITSASTPSAKSNHALEWGGSTFTEAEYKNRKSICHLWWQDPSRIDFMEIVLIQLIPHIPSDIHPNFLTLATLSCYISLLIFSTIIFFNWNSNYNININVDIDSQDINTNNNNTNPLLNESLLCIICAICVSGVLTFDWLDGMHARATKQVSRVGGLLDHWFDSFGTIIVASSIILDMNVDTQYFPLATEITLFGPAIVYHLQFEIYYTFTQFPRAAGCEGLLAVIIALLIKSVLNTNSIWIILITVIIMYGIGISCIDFICRNFLCKQSKFELIKIMNSTMIVFCLSIFVTVVLFETKYLSKYELVLWSIIISLNFNGKLVICTSNLNIKTLTLNPFDLVFIIGAMTIFIFDNNINYNYNYSNFFGYLSLGYVIPFVSLLYNMFQFIRNVRQIKQQDERCETVPQWVVIGLN